MFLDQEINTSSNPHNKREYRFRTADRKNIVVLELALNPGVIFDREEVERAQFKRLLVREFDYRNKGNRNFLQKAESFKKAWMEGKFGSEYRAPLVIGGTGRIFVPATDENSEVDLARV